MALASARRDRPVEDPSHPCNPRRLGFLSDIAKDPDNNDARLVYADWLQDHGDEEDKLRAEFIRVQIDDSLRDYDYVNEWVSPRISVLLNKSGGFYQRDLAFLGGELLSRDPIHGSANGNIYYPYHVYRRGLIDEIGWTTMHHRRLWARLRQLLPVTKLTAFDGHILSADVACPWVVLHGLQHVSLPLGAPAEVMQDYIDRVVPSGLTRRVIFTCRSFHIRHTWFLDSSENAEPCIFSNITPTKEY